MFRILATARACGDVGAGSGVEVVCDKVSSDGGAEGLIDERGSDCDPVLDNVESGTFESWRIWSRISTDLGMSSAARISLNM